MKTTTVSVYAAFFFILVLSVSCRRDSEASDVAFQKIEMCMESLPDTALYLLKSVPHPEKLRGKSQADYALLLTQAMDQNYVKFTSDSLIALALILIDTEPYQGEIPYTFRSSGMPHQGPPNLYDKKPIRLK